MNLDLDKLNQVATTIMDKKGPYTYTLCGFLQTCVVVKLQEDGNCDVCPLGVVQPIELIQKLEKGTEQDIIDEIKIRVILGG